jgi:t-SNARE complex subunit (syntaxin)
MQESALNLSDTAMARVEKMCTQMQIVLSESLERIVSAVDNMHASLENFSSKMLSLQLAMADDIQDIKRCIATDCHVKPEDLEGLGHRLVLVRLLPLLDAL